MRRVLWALSRPVREYWLRSERKLGKRFLVDRVLKRLLPAPPRGFEAELPGGARVFLHYREDIGLVTLLGGGFERAELEAVRAHARTGTTAIDVGANVGVFTVVLARAVGPEGRVLAFEPFADNVGRLEHNVDLNGLRNVDVREAAVGARAGDLELRLGADPAFHSTTEVAERRGEGHSVRVRATTLDYDWRAAGSPEVSVVKIDIEGGELAVLDGARELLATQRPVLLVEERDAAVATFLRELGYVRATPSGFARGNALFVSGDH